MIKKILVALGLILLSSVLMAQPVQSRAGQQVTVLDVNLFSGSSFKLPAFLDTIKANQAYTLDSCGRMIFTYKTNTIWYRACSPKRWVEIKNQAAPPVAIQNGLISGGIVTQLDSVTYSVSPAVYVINNVQYTAQADTFTIAPFDTLPRIDLIGADTTGHFYLDTGVANVYPLAPTPNPQSEIGISFIFVSTDTSSSSTIIYNNVNVAIENTLFVTKNGDDATGMRTVLTKPFLTVSGAMSKAQAGDLIIVYPGVYEEKVTLKNNVNIYLYDSATLYNKNDYAIFKPSNQLVNSTIDGYGTILSTGTPAIYLSQDATGSYITIRAKYIHSEMSTTYTIVNGGVHLDLYVDKLSGGMASGGNITVIYPFGVFKQEGGLSNIKGNIVTQGKVPEAMKAAGYIRGISCFGGTINYYGNINSAGNSIYSDNGIIVFNGNAISSDNNTVVGINGSKISLRESFISSFGITGRGNGIVHKGDLITLKDVHIECSEPSNYSIETQDEENKNVIVYNSCYASNRFKDTTSYNTLALKFLIGRENLLIKDSLYAHASLDTTHHVPVIQLAHNTPMDGWVIKYDSVNNRAIWDTATSGGGGLNQNFANADLTATGDRFHNFANKQLWIDSISAMTLTGRDSTLPYMTSGIVMDPTVVQLISSYDTSHGSYLNVFQDSIDITTINNNMVHIDTIIKFYDKYKFPNSNPSSGKVLGYLAPNTLGWVTSGIDSLKRSSDSIYAYKNSSWIYQYKDSVGGGGQNGRFGNDTATVVMAKVHNDAGTTLTNGTVVYFSTSGTSSDAPSVRKANNKADSTSANTIGFVHGSIAANDTGWVILSGKIEKLNTSAFANGDIIYLDSISGQWTKTKPVAPYHMVYLGVVVKANAGNGSIFVKVQNGYELDEIHDVKITNKLNNQVLAYSDTQKLWKNRDIYSIVDTTNTISTKYRVDTMRTNIYNSLSTKLNKCDSTLYQTKYRTDTMRTNIYSTLNGKMNYSDTVSLSNRINNKQEDIVDILNILGGSFKSKVVGADFLNAISSLSLGNSTQYFLPIYLSKADTVKGIEFYQRTQGAYTANNYNGVLLYSYSAGTLTLIDSTANNGNIWKGTTNTWQTVDFVNKIYCQPGLYYISLLYNYSAQTTAPALQSFGSVGGTNFTQHPSNTYKIYGSLGSRTTAITSQSISSLTAVLNNPFILIH